MQSGTIMSVKQRIMQQQTVDRYIISSGRVLLSSTSTTNNQDIQIYQASANSYFIKKTKKAACFALVWGWWLLPPFLPTPSACWRMLCPSVDNLLPQNGHLYLRPSRNGIVPAFSRFRTWRLLACMESISSRTSSSGSCWISKHSRTQFINFIKYQYNAFK